MGWGFKEKVESGDLTGRLKDFSGAAELMLESNGNRARAEIRIAQQCAGVSDTVPQKMISRVALQFRNHDALSEPEATLEILATRKNPEKNAKDEFRGISGNTEWEFTVTHKGKTTRSKNPELYPLPEGKWSLEADSITYISRNMKGPQRTEGLLQKLWADSLPEGGTARTR